MIRKLIPLLALALFALALAAPAQALPPGCEDPEDCPPQEVSHSSTLTVTMPTQGNVSGTGINCGGGGTDCTESFSWTEICSDFGQQRECSDSEVEDPVLTASGGPSTWVPQWSGCTTVSPERACTVHMNAAHAVSMSFVDITAPSVGLSSPATLAGPATVFTATADDNTAISKVDFYVDDVLEGTDDSAPYQFTPDVDLYTHGTQHMLKAISQDSSGNRSSSLASATGHAFAVDKQTSLVSLGTPPAYVTSAPSISFTPPGDLKAGGMTCATKLGGTTTGSTDSCSSPYTAQLGGAPTDGAYTVEFRVEDAVGNVATPTRSFTLDRGAPNLTITSPAAGALVGGPFTAGYTAHDGFTPDGDLDVQCKLGSGAFGSCAGLAPADGARTLTVRATDLAGNAEEKSVDFTYDATAPVTKITAGPSEGSVVYTRGASFSFTVADLSAVTRSCRLDGGAFGACTSATGHTLSGLGLGIHTFTLRVTDAAGHVTMVQRRFTVADRPTDTTPPTVIVNPPITDIIEQILNPSLSSDFDAFKGYTRYKRLVVKRVPAGATVSVTCKGKKCPAKSFKKTRAGNVKLSKFVKKRLRAGTTLTIRVTKPGAIGKQFVIKIRPGKRPALKISQIA